MNAVQRRALESVRHNIDQMQEIMNAVRDYLDYRGLHHVPLNRAGIDRLAVESHALLDKAARDHD